MSAALDSSDATTSPLYVRSVAKAFAVLKAFDGGHRSMSLSEIAAAVDMTKSAAQRFTYTLGALGLLYQDPASRRWQLTPRTLDIGTSYLAADSLIEQATPYLVELNHRCGESVNLSRPDGLDMVFVARFTSHARAFVHMPVGTRIPMFCTASGRAYLSSQPPSQAANFIQASTLHAFTAHTLTNADEILTHVAESGPRGFATASEEFYLGDLNIAAPILAADGSSLGAVNVSCPTSRWTLERMVAEIAPLLIQTVRRISGGPSARQREQISR
ncbi:IclR family transcriptional regulator [Salinisphaera aquimarina]|uniref:IclR family transcriptional regulator n=1 Tax=Salinisphaera aquimarina TaxID=2094031 RepID=A0ABV7EUV1_9GAMM